MQGVLEQNRIAELTIDRTKDAFGGKIGLFGKIFGCWHKRLTRPFTNKNASYRACLDCGARRRFSPENLRTFGPFHYPPAVMFEEN